MCRIVFIIPIFEVTIAIPLNIMIMTIRIE